MHGKLSGEGIYPSLELRISTRYEFSADIEIEWCSKRVWGHIRNISRSGMLIELSELPEVNSRFFANLALNKLLRIECVVRRVVPQRGVGVIVIPGEEARTRYEALLVALALGSGPAAAGVELPPDDEPQRPLVACAR
jgi:hypothetical protein